MRTLTLWSCVLIASLCWVACGDDQGGDPTGGCGYDPGIATGEWVERSVNVNGTSRAYFVWLPADYDPDRAYPVVYQFHGCSDNRETNNVPVQNESGGDAIHVRGRAVDPCWDDAVDGTGVAFFDAVVPAVEGEYCAQMPRVVLPPDTAAARSWFTAWRASAPTCCAASRPSPVATARAAVPGRWPPC